VTITDAEVAAWCNGYSALWHPAVVRLAGGPPRVSSPFDHEQPSPEHVYAVPDHPPHFLPDDWDRRVRDAGAVAFTSTADRDQTLANLKEALRAGGQDMAESALLLDLGPERVAPFLAIGFGYVVVEALFEAMQRENQLPTADVWQDLQQAIPALGSTEPDRAYGHLQSAAQRLLSARELLYAAPIYLIDLFAAPERQLGEPWPATFEEGLPVNVVACASLLERLGQLHPEKLARLRERLGADLAEVCGGLYLEREEAILPAESQIWNLMRGQAVSKELLGRDVTVFARQRTSAHPQLPLFLSTTGLNRGILLAFDDGVLPTYRSTVTNWPSTDGKSVEAFTRTPVQADSPQTFYHAAYYLYYTIMNDHSATLALLHRNGTATPWYRDWVELSRLAPVLGQWHTLSHYLSIVQPGEYPHAAPSDDFHSDYLSERCERVRVKSEGTEPAEAIPTSPVPSPVAWFARHTRRRRRLDAAGTLLALHRSLAGASGADPELDRCWREIEDRMEAGLDPTAEEWEALEKQSGQQLAQRLLARATEENPGYLVLNPCSFTRRVALELEDGGGPVPITGPVKACQVDNGKRRLVVEVPALGFAWFPRSGPAGAPPQVARMRLADTRHVRNEFFEAEVDPATGGLRAIRDHRTRTNRLGQQLVWNPGSAIRLKEIRTTVNGPALGEVVSEGALLDNEEQVIATFRQRFRAWLGRPVLEMRIEIYPVKPPTGYPWHSYYAARFAWRDERALLLRGVVGTPTVTSHTRPDTPDFLEVRQGRANAVILPGGLPFYQRHGGRMIDAILVPPGEMARAFDIGISLDRDYPMQTAVGMVTPVSLVPVAKGPPHIGASGWLFHLDAPNLVLTSLRPAPDGADAVVARLLECSGHSGSADLRCPRNPPRAGMQDARGLPILDASVYGDTVSFEVSQGELINLRVDFS
jgi:hypothetical protein